MKKLFQIPKFWFLFIGLLLGALGHSTYSYKWYIINAPVTNKIETTIKKQNIKKSPGATNQNSFCFYDCPPCPCLDGEEDGKKKKKRFLFFGRK